MRLDPTGRGRQTEAMRRQRIWNPWTACLSTVLAGALALAGAAGLAAQSGTGGAAPVMPRYDPDGALHLPDDYLRWTLAGASLGLSYGDEAPRRESFNHTLIEPTAYNHFVRTGEFREGTMLALLVRRTEADAMPARHGRFAADVLAVELAVKDSGRVAAGWAYYDFGGGSGARTTAQPQPPGNRCYACHVEHAARDNVFLQFYPLLADAAGVTVD